LLVWASGLGLVDFLHVGFGFGFLGLLVGLGFGFWTRGSAACRFWASGFGPEGFLLVGLGFGFRARGFPACRVWALGLGLRVWRLCLLCILPVYFGAPYAFNKFTYLSKNIYT
jgi:hypothetical protein